MTVFQKLPALFAGLPAQRAVLARAADRLRNRQQHLAEVAQALELVRRGWLLWDDPGRRGPTWFWLRWLDTPRRYYSASPRITRAVPFFATDFICDLAAAQAGVHPSGWQRPIHIPLGRLAEAGQRPCPNCGHLGPTLGCYYQTVDSPAKERWELTAYVLCPAEQHLCVIARQANNRRFLHELNVDKWGRPTTPG